MEPTIRPANPDDAPAIAQTHVQSWRAAYPGLVPQPYLDSLDIQEFTERWRERLTGSPGPLIHVAQQGGLICGFAAAGANRGIAPGFTAELYAIYLLPSAQRGGLGSRLFWSVAQALALSGHTSMCVWVLEGNPSRRFYERTGGTPCGRTTIEIGGQTLVETAYGWSHLLASCRARALPL